MNDFSPESYCILAVDDSDLVLRLVDTALTREGFNVMTAFSGEEALKKIAEHGMPHLAVVDINMPPGMDGFELCEKLHEFSDMPVIMLTAVDEEQTIIQAIEQHAEDYITKPFSTAQLIARVSRVLQRIGNFAFMLNSPIKVDNRLSVDFPNYRIIINEKSVSLTPTETKLLYILMRDAGDIVSTEYILRRLWPMQIAYEDRLRVYVHRLRSKIEGKAKNKPQYVVSHRGKGYTFLAPQ